MACSLLQGKMCALQLLILMLVPLLDASMAEEEEEDYSSIPDTTEAMVKKKRLKLSIS